MRKRTAPFVTPFAIMSAVLALGATNVAVNKVTHTSEGARVSRQGSSVVSNKLDDSNLSSSATTSVKSSADESLSSSDQIHSASDDNQTDTQGTDYGNNQVQSSAAKTNTNTDVGKRTDTKDKTTDGAAASSVTTQPAQTQNANQADDQTGNQTDNTTGGE